MNLNFITVSALLVVAVASSIVWSQNMASEARLASHQINRCSLDGTKQRSSRSRTGRVEKRGPWTPAQTDHHRVTCSSSINL
ncbi:hypothetical protein FHW20_003495 [Ochrobactrum intermedium]|uniref:Secreted protein n=1 Tax=Brucella intermedia TaxID=94625 RepID=A0ABR6AST2_9HYPH|nr:hypothetical protein [Brucella intermedia]